MNPEPPIATDLEQSYEHCRRITKENAKNFYYAFLTLPGAKRRAIYASYAFCRLCDDIADEEMPLDEKRSQLAETRRLLAEMSEGIAEGPVFSALEDAARSYGIPVRHFEEVIEGVEMDLTWDRFQNFEELRNYCYKVASAVGLICVEVFGYEDPRARDYAVDLGLGMQLTNIIRDVLEDSKLGRIYIPLDEMERFGYTEDELMNGTINDAFLRLMSFQAARAREHLDSGKRLLSLLSGSSRACPAVLQGIYSAVLDRIEDRDFNVFEGRVSLSARKKIFLMTKIWARSLLPQPTPNP